MTKQFNEVNEQNFIKEFTETEDSSQDYSQENEKI